MTHITCRLTAKNRDQLRNPSLGNLVWITFTFLYADDAKINIFEILRYKNLWKSLNFVTALSKNWKVKVFRT